MNNILKPLSFLFLFITFITGCNKNEPILPNVKQVSQNNIDKQDVLNNINLEDGVLNFTSKDYIVKTQYILAYDSTNSFKKRLNEKFPNFISSIIAFKSLTQQDTLKILNGSKDYKDYVRLIDENNVYSLELNSTSIDLCRLLNKKGLISFGDSIVKLTYDNVFVTTKAYYQSLGKPDLELIKDAGVHTTPLIHRLQKNTNKATLRWNIDYVNSDFNIGGVPRRQSEIISEDWNYFSWQLTFTSKYMYQGNFLGIF